MANKTLQNTINWVAPLIHFMPLTIGTSNEPAITNANMVQQMIVGPPFCWDWNRATVSFTATSGQQDYTQTVADFGFTEKAAVTLNGDVKELTVQTCLGSDSKRGRPDYIAAQTDDNAGHITFRLMKVPDQAYTVTVTYQKKPTLFTALSDQWVVPDAYQFVCNYGFLALALLHLDDPRLPLFNQKFMSSLLSTNRGLSEMERNIFVGNWLALTRQEISEQLKSQQAVQARGI